MLAFKVRIWLVRSELICNSFGIAVLGGSGTVEPKINAHRRSYDLSIELNLNHTYTYRPMSIVKNECTPTLQNLDAQNDSTRTILLS